jgi:predicted ATPase/class 3 adenylate cyclase
MLVGGRPPPLEIATRARNPGGVRDELPGGTVTFLFSDIEGSTRLLDELGPERYAEALAEHRRRMRAAFAAHGGVEVDTQGDAFFVAFPDAAGALAAARRAQAALADGPIRVRIGLHSGEPLLTGEGYVGVDVHRGARVMSAGHGGQVLVSEATYALLDGESGLTDLGLHRLKDLTEPQRVWQLGDGEFPPLKTLYQANLPVQPTPLVGREAELAQVLALLRESRLVTLTGAGGSGKTRLALQAAAELVEEFKDGVWWVSLAALRDPKLVEPTIAQVVGAKEELQEHIGDRRMLLLLDNLEQVIEAATDIAALLAATPHLKVLVTSREPLQISGEAKYQLDPLPEDDAVELFLARAEEREPLEAVRAICRRLDGLPLAIELAAARTRLLPPAQLLVRLEQRLRLLTGVRRDAPERQRTLRATIAWSYDLLDPEEQRLFARLAVFAGSFEVEAAEAVCEAQPDSLQSLLEKSLLRRWSSGRLGMLETIHEYAGERLEESGEQDELRRRHADHFAAMARQARREMAGEREVSWLDRLDKDHDNLRAAHSWAVEAAPEVNLTLVSSLRPFWHRRGHVAEGRSWLEPMLSGAHEPSSETATALADLAFLALRQGDTEVAQVATERALAEFEHLGDRRGAADCFFHLGWIAAEEGDDEQAARFFEQNVELRRELDDRSGLAYALTNLGDLAVGRGDARRAASALEEGLALQRELRDEWGTALASHNLAVAKLEIGEHAEATALLADAVQATHRLGDRELLAAAFEAVAALIVQDEPEVAARLLGASQHAVEELRAQRTATERAMRDRTLETLRTALGAQSLRESYGEGSSLELDELCAPTLGLLRERAASSDAVQCRP